MKVPRIEDFDPNAAPKLGSPMDTMPRIEKPAAIPGEPAIQRPPPPTRVIPEPKSESPQVHKTTRPHVDKTTSPQVDLSTSKPAYIRDFLSQKATETPTFRCPPALWEKVEELQFVIKQRYHVKPDKTAIMVAAMAAMFWDIEHDDPESDGYKLLRKMKEDKRS